MTNDNGPVSVGTGDPGKGTVTRPPNDGTLWQDSKPGQHKESHGEFTFEDGSGLRGDDKAFGGSTTTRPMDSGAPIWLDGASTDSNATNSGESIVAHCKSDSMFERYPSATSDPDKSSGTNAADKVSSDGLDGAKSDPEFERYPDAGSQEDEGNKMSGNADYTGR